MNIIALAKNYSAYTSGYYHNDIVNALKKISNCYVFGLGYPDYALTDTIDEVIKKSGFVSVDYIVVCTSWDDDTSVTNVDPHPSINLSKVDLIPKVYFLNKEYKKFDLRIQYCLKNNFDLITTVHPDAEKWSKEFSLNIKQNHFGIDVERFSLNHSKRKYDFAFTGSLHSSHIDFRAKVKRLLFKEMFIKNKSNKEWRLFGRNPLKDKYKSIEIYWAEFGARGMWGNGLLPFGDEYASFLANCKVFLNTPSAVGIFNTRFFELMATRTLILCPDAGDYYGLLENNVNCMMFKSDMSDFDTVLDQAVFDNDTRKRIVENANQEIKSHDYTARLQQILMQASR